MGTTCCTDSVDFDIDRNTTRRINNDDSSDDGETEQTRRKISNSHSKNIYYYDAEKEELIEIMEEVDA